MKNIMKMFGSLIIFLYIQYIIMIVMLLLGMSFGAEDYYMLTLFNFVNDLVVCIIMIILSRKVLKKGISSMKGNINMKKDFIFIWDIVVGFTSLIVYKYLSAIVSATLSNMLGIESQTVENQVMVESLLGSAPALMAIATCILAPIVEELVFRGAIREAIKNKKVFITVSGLIFGLMHVTTNLFLLFGILIVGLFVDYMINHKDKFKGFPVTEKILYVGVLILYAVLLVGNNSQILLGIDASEVVGSIVYVSLGWYLAHLYAEKDNIFYPIIVHSLNNIFSVLMVLL